MRWTSATLAVALVLSAASYKYVIWAGLVAVVLPLDADTHLHLLGAGLALSLPTAKAATLRVIGAARNCAADLPRVLEQADAIGARYFDAWEVSVFENDSTDDTPAVLQRWRAAGPGRFVVTERAVPGNRTLRIAHARNTLLDRLPAPANDDVVLVMDLDEVNHQIDIDSIGPALERMRNDAWAAMFPNQQIEYYDRWALRTGREDPRCRTKPWLYCPVLTSFGLPFGGAIPRTAAPVAVESAFGGFGFYRQAAVGQCRYNGMGRSVEDCEHVAFHACIRANSDNGGLYIVPSMLNTKADSFDALQAEEGEHRHRSEMGILDNGLALVTLLSDVSQCDLSLNLALSLKVSSPHLPSLLAYVPDEATAACLHEYVPTVVIADSSVYDIALRLLRAGKTVLVLDPTVVAVKDLATLVETWRQSRRVDSYVSQDGGGLMILKPRPSAIGAVLRASRGGPFPGTDADLAIDYLDASIVHDRHLPPLVADDTPDSVAVRAVFRAEESAGRRVGRLRRAGLWADAWPVVRMIPGIIRPPLSSQDVGIDERDGDDAAETGDVRQPAPVDGAAGRRVSWWVAGLALVVASTVLA